jgi:hypothetical protein
MFRASSHLHLEELKEWITSFLQAREEIKSCHAGGLRFVEGSSVTPISVPGRPAQESAQQ